MTTTKTPKTARNPNGAGRKKGSPNKKNAALQAEVAASGITPLAFMLNRMRTPPAPGLDRAALTAHEERQFEAAKAAAPYVHAKLANVELTGKDGGSILVQALSDEALSAKIAETLARLNGSPAAP